MRILVIAARIMIAAIVAVIVGAAGGWLTWLESGNPPRAVRAAERRTGATIALALAVTALLVHTG